MRAWLLSLITPRRVLQRALYEQWRRTLPRDQRIRLDYWGTAGPGLGHHPFQWADDINATPPPQPNVEGARYVHVGFQWRARASADDLWSPWRDGPCPAPAPKGSETEERRVYALAATALEDGR